MIDGHQVYGNAAGAAAFKVCGISCVRPSWVARYVPLMLSKNFVQGVIWNQLHDSRPHNFPYGGLFDLRRRAKPALRTLAALRQAILK